MSREEFDKCSEKSLQFFHEIKTKVKKFMPEHEIWLSFAEGDLKAAKQLIQDFGRKVRNYLLVR